MIIFPVDSSHWQILQTIKSRAQNFYIKIDENPIDSLTTDEIKSIYHGDITNWKELNGKNEEIIAFQRPERSGSQSMMTYFMGDVTLKEPLTYEMEMAMMGIIKEVAEFDNKNFIPFPTNKLIS